MRYHGAEEEQHYVFSLRNGSSDTVHAVVKYRCRFSRHIQRELDAVEATQYKVLAIIMYKARARIQRLFTMTLEIN